MRSNDPSPAQDSTASVPPSSSLSTGHDNEPIETATWTRRLPESFGIRNAVQQSKYRWCTRESGLWGIATGTTMTLHRLRMQSSTLVAVNVGFASFFTVFVGSYYFCVKRRDYREKMIQLMMKLNSFEHALNMPESVPVNEEHPFVTPDASQGEETSTKQYVAHLPERKEWQAPLPSQQDASTVFQPTDTESSRSSSSRSR